MKKFLILPIINLVPFSLTLAQSVGSLNPQLAQTRNQGSFQNQNSSESQVIQTAMPQKSLARRLFENTSLGYYQQFLGPTAKGPGSQTYNVFQEGIDSPGSGQAPLQSFHALSLRHQITTKWSVAASLSAVNGYTEGVENVDRGGSTFLNGPKTDFFNARVSLGLPAIKTSPGTLFTTLSYEQPTSSISKEDEMRWGWVVAQSFAFNLPDYRWSAGLMGQVYRIYYQNNVKAPPFSPALGGRPIPLQTLIVSGGPYVNYRFSDKWMLGSLLTFDWDQRGLQTDSREFNNNLSDRGRIFLSYFPQKLKYLQSVGVFSQALIKFRPETTAFGADFSIRF